MKIYFLRHEHRNKNDYLNNTSCLISQRSLYKYIYNELQIYFKSIYNYWPKCINKLNNSNKVIKFKQKLSANNYVFNYYD